MVVVKRMNKAYEQDKDEFCKELLTRLYHRHLIALKGFCTKSHERFLMYECIPNGSSKDQLPNFGLAHASKDGSIFFESVNIDIKGTPGYTDPEYVITQKLIEKSFLDFFA
ncbi:hypothetical protein BC332_23746 [Capsicum chinense]|nr:hypothetical protein BC332_23746 [Capsicum chinense]